MSLSRASLCASSIALACALDACGDSAKDAGDASAAPLADAAAPDHDLDGALDGPGFPPIRATPRAWPPLPIRSTFRTSFKGGDPMGAATAALGTDAGGYASGGVPATAARGLGDARIGL